MQLMKNDMENLNIKQDDITIKHDEITIKHDEPTIKLDKKTSKNSGSGMGNIGDFDAGQAVLADANRYIYNRNARNGDLFYLTCQNDTCCANAVWNTANNKLNFAIHHNHDADIAQYQELLFRQALRHRAATENIDLQEIFQQERVRNPIGAQNVVFEHLFHLMYRARNQSTTNISENTMEFEKIPDKSKSESSSSNQIKDNSNVDVLTSIIVNTEPIKDELEVDDNVTDNLVIKKDDLDTDEKLDDIVIKKEELEIVDHLIIKEEKLNINLKENLIENRYGDCFLEDRKEFVKIENGEQVNEIKEINEMVVDVWKIKHEEINIKAEDDSENDKTSMLPNCIGQKTNEDFTEHKYPQGDYQTVFEGRKKPEYLVRFEEVEKLQYDHSDHKTLSKGRLKRHLTKIKNPGDEVALFKCDQCDYHDQTCCKHFLKRHLIKHTTPVKRDIFTCDQCDHKTLWKRCLKRHMMKHKNPEEVVMFKCNECDYKTILNYNLKKHYGRRHTNPVKIGMFKCKQCNYITNRQVDLKVHVLKHRIPEEINISK